jgi:DNA-binding transcriptional ArsR family regulator
MVEYNAPLDLIFQSLAAIAKHIGVLERAGLVTKQRAGKEKLVRLVPETIQAAGDQLAEYEKLWSARYDALEELLKKVADKESQWPRSKSPSRKSRKT